MPAFDPVKYFGQESSKYANLLRGIYQCTNPEAMKRIGPLVERKYLQKVRDEPVLNPGVGGADVKIGGAEDQTRVVCFEKKSKKKDFWLDLQAQVELDNNPERLSWLRNLLKFMEERGTPITKSPSVPDDSNPGRALDLYCLFKLTMIEAGGMRRCNDSGGWSDIARRMEFPREKSYMLPTLYQKFLLPFEEHQKQEASNLQAGGVRDQALVQSSSVKSGKRKIIFEENGNEVGAVRDLRARLNKSRRSVFSRLGKDGKKKKSKKNGKNRVWRDV